MKPLGLTLFSLIALSYCAPSMSKSSTTASGGGVSAQDDSKLQADLFAQCMKKFPGKTELSETQCRIYAAAGDSVILRGQAKTLYGVPNTIFWPYNPPMMNPPERGVDGECGISFWTGSMDDDESVGKNIISSFGGWSGKALLAWYKQKDKNRRRIESDGNWIEYDANYKITSYGYKFNIVDRTEGQTIPPLETPIWICKLPKAS